MFYDGSFYAADLGCYGEEDLTKVVKIAAYWWGEHGNGTPAVIGNLWDTPELMGREYV
jgi:hypothetical protein